MSESENGCVFCRIIAGQIETALVHEDEHTIVFLDSGPLFPGHCLICPRVHYDTLMDVPPELLQPLFQTAQLIARAMEREEAGLSAQGSFVAVNNRVSQSVPHLHVHVIPRRKGDGMKGFFWPRRPYRDSEHMRDTQQRVAAAVTYCLQNV
ncbi:MAG: HIT family protein [Bryobacteraceae bacterium]|nr:HIT family protein [Bryobacteraceae bacterium]